MKSIFFKKIIWAVDALEAPEQHIHALSMLAGLARSTSTRIEPVYVLSSPYAQIEGAPPTEFEEAFRALAEKRMAELVRNCDIPSMASGKILVNRSGSIRKDVESLIEYGEAEEADVIIVATHARKGMPRFFFGSFAETLALHSTIPIITVNPETKVRSQVSKILFPTTFQSRFRGAFERVAGLAKILEAQLTLFHKEPIVPYSQMSEEVYKYIASEEKARAKRATDWMEWAVRIGVNTEIRLDNKPGYLVDAIDGLAAEKEFDLIAMASEASQASALVMGSITRKVLRSATCPVWIVRVDEAEDIEDSDDSE